MYGGTSEEMYRLLQDAANLNEEFANTANFSLDAKGHLTADFADIVDAIHIVQTEMGITGTTSKEASSTIQGSLASMRSAWANLVTGIADENANMDVLIDNFVTSVSTAGDNIIPRIEQILVGVGETVAKLAPILGEKVPGIVVAVLPSLLNAGTSLFLGLVQGIMDALPELAAVVPTIIETFVTTVSANLPAILASGQMLLSMFGDGIMTAVPAMIERLSQVIDDILNFITDHLPDVLNKGVELLNNLVTGILNGIPGMLAKLPQIITSFVKFIVENLPVIAQAGMDILANLVTGVLDNLPAIGNAVGQIIGAIVSGIGDLLGSVVEVGANIVTGIWDGIVGKIDWIKEKVTGFFGGVVDGVKDFLGIHSPSRVFAGIGENMAAGLGKGWDDEYASIKKDIEGGMNFGTGTVDFSTSRLKTSMAGAPTAVNSPVTIPITLELDGEVLARKTYRYNQQESARVGYAMVKV